MKRGTLVTIDGPGGVGKSTLAASLTATLGRAGVPVHATRQPSATPLGDLIRNGTDTYRGRALAMLVAADRAHHLDTEIRPALNAGRVVICDRYVPSSLVLQGMDGVSHDQVWTLNAGADTPDLAVIVTADPAAIAGRLGGRGAHSRFEHEPGSTVREIGLYASTADFLAARGWRLRRVDATSRAPDALAVSLAADILPMTTWRTCA